MYHEKCKYYQFLADKFKRQFTEPNKIFRRDPQPRDSKATASNLENQPKTSSKQPVSPPTSPTAAPISTSYITIIPEDKSVNDDEGYLKPQIQKFKTDQAQQQQQQRQQSQQEQSGYLQPTSQFKFNIKAKNKAPEIITDNYLIPTSPRKVSQFSKHFLLNNHFLNKQHLFTD